MSSRRPHGPTSRRSTRWVAPWRPSRVASSSARSRRPPTGRRESSTPPPTQKIDPEGERRQVEGLRRVRAERDPAAWKASLDRLDDAARGDENLMPFLIEAVKAYATVGEIADHLRDAWGGHRGALP